MVGQLLELGLSLLLPQLLLPKAYSFVLFNWSTF